jgi:hypothetical protein
VLCLIQGVHHEEQTAASGDVRGVAVICDLA